MCPACMTTAALLVTGATSATGLTALLLKKLREPKDLPPGQHIRVKGNPDKESKQ